MKTGIFIAFSYVHTIALSTGAATIAEDWKWSTAGALAAWLGGAAASFIPIVRTVFLGALLVAATGSWLALLLALPGAFLLNIIESMGTAGLKREAQAV